MAIGAALALAAGAASALATGALWDAWPTERFVPTAAPCLRHDELVARLAGLAAAHPGRVRLERAGESVQGRSIHLVTIGHGAREVLLWSQMHGDEPSATPALLDIADYLARHGDDPDVRRILSQLTLRMVPMLNPDGAETYVRRNAQGIDVNRDALNLASPEGRLLKTLRDRFSPVLGCNLHDQNRRRAVGETGALASHALLAVAGDAAGTVTAARRRAARAAAAVVAALEPYFPGGLARYDDEFSPRAFGDNLTAWGTPVLLVESGGVPTGSDLSDLTRANFVALLAVLDGLARDDLAAFDPAVYEALPENEPDAWADVVIAGGKLLQPGAGPVYRADLAFDRLASDRVAAGCVDPGAPRSRIVEVGDARFYGATERLDGVGRTILAPFEVGVDGWAARQWLDAPGLERLGRLGVARVVWSVPTRLREEALVHADRWRGEGRPAVEVAARGGTLPPVRLERLPREPASRRLADRLDALFAARSFGRSGDGDLRDRLKALWAEPAAPGLPPLLPGSPASFSLVEGEGDLSDARIVATWLEGVEVAREGAQ